MSIDAINYLALNTEGNKQVGSDNEATEEINYTDGLSAKELQTIDKNGDGVVTKEEFIAAYNGGTENDEEINNIWNSYLNYYNSTTVENSDSSDTSKTQIGTAETGSDSTTSTTSTYENGELVSYTRTIQNDDGTLTVEEYTVTNGEAILQKSTTTETDGTVKTTEYDKYGKFSSCGIKTLDGTIVTTDENGNITGIMTSTGNDIDFADYINEFNNIIANYTVSIKEDEDGKVYKLTDEDGNVLTDEDGNEIIGSIDNKGNIVFEYSDFKLTINSNGGQSIELYDGNGNISGKLTINSDGGQSIEIYDGNGNISGKLTINSDGTASIDLYDEDGNKSESISINSDGEASEILDYTDGKLTIKIFCTEENLIRYYAYDEKDGNLKYAYDVDTENEKTIRKITLYEDGNYKNKYETVTNYDPDTGEVTTTKYLYSQSDDGTTTTTKIKYDKDGNVLSKTAETYDSDGNIVQSVTTDYKDSTVTTDNYTDGKVTSKTVETIANGTSTSVKYTYEYYSNGTMKYETKTDSDGNTTTYKYTYYVDENGELIQEPEEVPVEDTYTTYTKVRGNGRIETYTYDATGKQILKTTTDSKGNLISVMGSLKEVLKVYLEYYSSEYPDYEGYDYDMIASYVSGIDEDSVFYLFGYDNSTVDTAIKKAITDAKTANKLYKTADETSEDESTTSSTSSSTETEEESASSSESSVEKTVVTENEDGTTLTEGYDSDENLLYQETRDSSENLLSVSYNIKMLISALHPELSSSEIDRIAEELINDTSNSIDDSSQLINYSFSNAAIESAISKYITENEDTEEDNTEEDTEEEIEEEVEEDL